MHSLLPASCQCPLCVPRLSEWINIHEDLSHPCLHTPTHTHTHTHTHPHTHTRKEKKRIQSAITHSCTARNWSGALGCWGLAHYYHVCLDFYRLFFPSLALSPCFSLSLCLSPSLSICLSPSLLLSTL